MKKYNYKFRAECIADIQAFIYLANLEIKDSINTVIEFNSRLADCVCTISTSLDIDKVRAIMANVPDSHVMLETLAFEPEYTGERTLDYIFGDIDAQLNKLTIKGGQDA